MSWSWSQWERALPSRDDRRATPRASHALLCPRREEPIQGWECMMMCPRGPLRSCVPWLSPCALLRYWTDADVRPMATLSCCLGSGVGPRENDVEVMATRREAELLVLSLEVFDARAVCTPRHTVDTVVSCDRSLPPPWGPRDYFACELGNGCGQDRRLYASPGTRTHPA